VPFVTLITRWLLKIRYIRHGLLYTLFWRPCIRLVMPFSSWT